MNLKTWSVVCVGVAVILMSGCSVLGERALTPEELEAQEKTLWAYYPQVSYATNIRRYVNPAARIKDTEVPKEQLDTFNDAVSQTQA